jgi:hypothetical protein
VHFAPVISSPLRISCASDAFSAFLVIFNQCADLDELHDRVLKVSDGYCNNVLMGVNPHGFKVFKPAWKEVQLVVRFAHNK